MDGFSYAVPVRFPIDAGYENDYAEDEAKSGWNNVFVQPSQRKRVFMDPIRCPYLGLPDDPDTRLDFPSPENVCHKAVPAGPIKLDYQYNTCLTAQHASCPIYTAAHAVPVPPALLAPTSRTATGINRRTLALVGLPLVLLLIALLGVNVLGNSSRNASSPESGEQDSNWAGLFSLPQTGAKQRSAMPNPTDIQRSTTCPPPDGWVTYTVNPTDSLYRLSVLHAVSVRELQQSNCMGNETVILPGQVIYIPFTPTLTPTATSTRLIPTWTATVDLDENIPVPENTATNEPPTEAQPTEAPTTAVTPTDAVPTTAPTTAPTSAPTSGVPTVALPTVVLPTVAVPTVVIPLPPTATPEPGDENDKNGRSQTIDCGGGAVTVDGNRNTITFTGTCLGLTVTGNNNEITVPPGTPVLNLGNGNVISEG